jgi:glycosyltransferase involved in cell wall biosynthesis
MLHRQTVAQAVLQEDWGRTPVVVDLHELPRALHGGRAGLAPGVDPRHFRKERRRILQALRLADLVTSEEGIDQHLADVFKLQVRAIPNVMSRTEVPAGLTTSVGIDQPPIRELLELGEHQPLIVYLGFYFPSRGVETLIEAFEQLPSDHHLALVVGWTGRPLVPRVRASGAADRIHLLDLVRQDQLIPFLRGSDLGVYLPDPPVKPHAVLCMPTKLYEFHAAEVPVLVADDPGLREFAARYGGTIVLQRPFTLETVARSISEIVASDDAVQQRSPTPDLVAVMRSVLESLGWRPTAS